jgi:hypothetical protein
MNEAQKTELKVVQISRGSVLSPSHVKAFIPYLSVTESREFYIGSRLTKDGNPPRNASNFSWQQEARWDNDGDPRGSVAVLDAEREVWADKSRARIQELQDAVEKEKLFLHSLYAGPRPSTRAEDLRKEFRKQ